jgi:hypothetical protein
VGTDQLPTPATRNIEGHIAGSVTGQVAIGERILQVDAKPGAIVNLYEGKPVVPRRRATPVLLPPRPFPGLIGRTTEVGAAKAAMRAGQPFEYFASPGWGKTSLLRYLGQLAAGTCPDGIVYQPSSGQPLDDLLQFCFDVFYETDVPFKPTPGQLRQSLVPMRALIILDDLDLDRDQLDALFASLPNSVFLLATRERTLWGSGQAESVGGLAKDAAIEVFEREIGRLLTAGEQPAFEQLWSSLGGNPLELIQAAAAVRENNQSLAALAGTDSVAPPGERIILQLVSSLTPDEQKILGLLGSVYDAGLPASHVAAITGVADAAAILLRLTHQGMTELIDGGYRLTKEPAGALKQVVDPQQWTEPSIRHFAAWAERFATDPRLILAVADLLLKVIDLATDTRRWKEVWQLMRAVQRSLALSGRWSAWQVVLNSGLQAANALDDRAGRGWVLHQLGTRSLCLGDLAAAGTFLNQALSIRQAIGDTEGVAATTHNIQRLAPPQPPPSQPPPTPIPTPTPVGRVPLLLRWFISLGISAALVVIFALNVWPLPGPVLAFEPNQPVGFHQVAVDRPAAPMTVKIHNTGNRSLRLGASGISVSPAFTKSDDCPLRLEPNVSCTVTLAFTPHTVGQQSGTLSIVEAGGSAHTLQVKGAGLAFNPSSLGFNRQTIKIPGKASTIQLKNWGDTDLVIRSITLTGDFKASDCTEKTQTIAPGATCTIAVTFVPTAPGARAGKLFVTDDRGNEYVAALSGVGLVPIAVLNRLIDFGPAQTTAATRQLTIYDKGEGALLISSISQGAAILTGTRTVPTPADPSPFSWKNSTDKPCLGAQISTGNSCMVEVTFTPPPGFANQSAGTSDPRYREYDADLHIIDNDPTSPQTVSLLGNNLIVIQ